LLLNANRVVPDEQLFSMVWGNDPPASVRGQVQVHISGLRKLIGEPVIMRRAPGYLIEVRPGELDLHAFDEAVAQSRADLSAGRVEAAADGLRGALALWRGPALGGVTEPLLAREGPGLRERRLSALEEFFHAQLAAGRHVHTVSELRRAADENPFRERIQSQLMLALHRCGRTSEALEVYAAVREKLVSDMGVEPGSLLQDMHVRLLRNEDHGQPVTAGSAVPRQLPADVTPFSGRAEELSHLDALLPSTAALQSAPVVAVTTVGGGAGVGKTALAVHWAHRVRHRFPDGQLYVNLRGFDPGGSTMSPAEAVRGFLDALEVPAQRIPVSAAAQFSLYRSLLADKQVLVLLDNARDVEQVRALLPGSPGCLTVVTSRNQLSGLVAVEGAHPVTLDLLSAADACELLARRVGADRVAAEPRAVEEIITLCARLPLALAIVAARAVTNPGFSLAALAGELREAGGGLDSFDGGDAASDVRAVFSWSYHAISPAAARLFRLLSQHLGPHVTIPAAASLLGVLVQQVRPLLAELTRAHLVAEPSPGRYTFHDLLRAYATELAQTHDSESDRRVALHRILDYYLHTAHSGARMLSPTRDPIVLEPHQPGVTLEVFSEEQAMNWIVTEHLVLLAAIERAVDTGFDAHAWQLACTLTSTFTHHGGHWLGELSTYRTALAAARRLGDPTGQAHSHRGLAVVYAAMGRNDDAHAELRHALELFRQLGDLVYEADVHQGLTWVYDRQRDPAQELRHAQQAYELYRAADHRPGCAASLNNVGWSYANLGNYELAINACQQALGMHEELGNRSGQANTWDSLGFAHHHLGHHDEAIACYQRALGMYRQVGGRFYEGRTLKRLGETYRVIGDPDAAHRAWRLALDILDELGTPEADEVRGKLNRAGK
jgi:tetratricopeptide (TPR) repeat protein/DNA-binding SARP family transcriptional activator